MGSDGLAGIRRALVVGLGASGRSVARLLAEQGVEVTVADDDEARRQDVPGTSLHTGPSAGLDPTSFDVVVPSPGVPEGADLVQRALQVGTPIWSEPEMAWRVRPTQLVGITGTNGKTTVTQLVTDMLVAGGIDAVACGNIGTPLSDVVRELPGDRAEPVLVAELSSFQLRFIDTLAPRIGVLLNVADDHADWHGSLDAYRHAKEQLFANAGPATIAIAGDDDVAREVVSRSRGAVILTSATGRVERGVGVADGTLMRFPDESPLVPVADLPTDAPHVVANAAASAAAAHAAGASDEAIAEALRGWQLGSHRLELVAEHRGVTWVDDSKATNGHATVAALASARSIVWVAGGQAKGADLTSLAAHLARVRHAILLGESADVLADICIASNVPVSRAGTMQQAVSMAAAEAHPGDTVLLSPAGASFDLFDGYADRGDQFTAAVRRLVEDRQEQP